MRRRIPVWLLLAVALLGGSAALMALSEGAKPARARAEVEFPRWPRHAELERARARRTQAARALPATTVPRRAHRSALSPSRSRAHW